MAASSANSAAMMRSPSFSRSSSSTTRIGRPAAMAVMAASIESRRLAWARESVMSDSLICVRVRTRRGGAGVGRCVVGHAEGQPAGGLLREHIDYDVHGRSDLELAEGRVLQRRRDQTDHDPGGGLVGYGYGGQGQRHPVEDDG